MADTDKDSKTEKPTGKRLEQARGEGNMPQAQEVGVTFTLLAGLLVVMFAGRSIANQVFSISSTMFGNLSSVDLSVDNISYFLNEIIMMLGRLSAPFLLTAMVAGVIAGGLQTKFRLTPKALGIKFNKLNPINGAKQLVSKDVFVRFGIDLLKMAAMGLILWVAMRKIIKDPIFYAEIDITHVGLFITDTMVYVFIRLTIAVGIIAILSYLWQHKKTMDGLKMTKEEVKQERKDQDMSPEVRKARMQMAMRLMQGQMLDDVATADVVVTNPTHYAVALKYERGVDSAPVVLAKGENAFAQRIKAVAAEHGVPVVENKMVARMLYKVSQVGSAIPMEMFQSVAEILAFVYKTHRYYFHKLKARRAALKKTK
ncbi:EscU/YscU/HrcU family type III secretion system export apparatus switch protein [Pelagicoccus sp. SDUM812005]|uniref:EscU/YscU/HrcU family type III secretion system export apparatus switch protein n=1 Tax=Pelagicoccus sp. SDUM812005 TaxID=3041257 RepID=UPI00280FAD38|nr:EscU/YscU/HrcU family type III secretion system export apparatus switch protein [Pelagicoccus sp. SDUM812005]MDQ8182332.1 EscU/YscU/HrcU family type III secretion system export apparatus switch protein [Pelagicoccus sp. SDUM812005]